MIAFDAFLPSLLESLALGSGDERDGLSLAVTEVEIEIPIEHRLSAEGLHAEAPGTRLVTGFKSHSGRMRARFCEDGGED
jgi:hypothetical protein